MDHVKDYKPPKDSDKLDDVTRQIMSQGCAPSQALDNDFLLPLPPKEQPESSAPSSTNLLQIKSEPLSDKEEDVSSVPKRREREKEKTKSKKTKKQSSKSKSERKKSKSKKEKGSKHSKRRRHRSSSEEDSDSSSSDSSESSQEERRRRKNKDRRRER